MFYVHLSLQNAVEKMRSLALVLASCFYLLQIVHCQELSVIRHSDGDIFTIEGKYSFIGVTIASIYINSQKKNNHLTNYDEI